MDARHPFPPFSPGQLSSSRQPPPGSAQSSRAHRLLLRQSPSLPPPDTYARRWVQREEGTLVKTEGIELGKASRGKAGADEGAEEVKNKKIKKRKRKRKKKRKRKGKKNRKKKINKRTEKPHTLVKLGALCKSAVSKQQITEARMQCRGRAYVTREAGLSFWGKKPPALPLPGILHTS